MISEKYETEAAEAQKAENDAKPEPIVQGEYLVDPDTGEVLGLVNKPKFEVNDQSSAEWVLEKMQTEDAEILALQARLKALTENLTTMLKSHQQKRAWLEMRFGPELARYAKDNLPKGKKTWTCPYGKVSFTSTPEKLKVRDKNIALKWAHDECQEAIKVIEDLVISSIPAETVEALLSAPMTADTFGFAIVPAGERVSIKTGV